VDPLAAEWCRLDYRAVLRLILGDATSRMTAPRSSYLLTRHRAPRLRTSTPTGSWLLFHPDLHVPVGKAQLQNRQLRGVAVGGHEHFTLPTTPDRNRARGYLASQAAIALGQDQTPAICS
jgi:hypothetical protein